MIIHCTRNDLNEAINMAQKAIALHTPNTLLQGILLDAEDKLTLTGYDLKTGIECCVDCDIEERGSVVINSKMLGDIVRKLPEDEVDLEVKADMTVLIKSGKSSFKIRGRESDEYPKIPIVETENRLSMSQKLFCAMVSQTIFACSTDESRMVLNGVYVEVSGQLATFVAIDGFRVAIRRAHFEQAVEAMRFIVPMKAMSDALKILDNQSDDPIMIYPSHNHILFDTGKVRMVSRLIQGDYMEYEKIIPASCMTEMVIESRTMLNALERASLVINVEQKRSPVTLLSDGSEILNMTAETDMGSVHEELPVSLSGEAIDVDFNPKFFVDVFKNLPDQTVQLSFTGNSGTCLIRPIEGDGFLYLILPLRR